PLPSLHPFPTRRSSDLLFVLRISVPVHSQLGDLAVLGLAEHGAARVDPLAGAAAAVGATKLGGEPRARRIDLPGLERHLRLVDGDRKSTRLNSSHGSIS